MIGIVVSRADSASEHVGERLRAIGDWTRHEDATRPDAEGGGIYYRTEGFELREFEGLHIDLSNPAAAFGESENGSTVAFLVFVSRHSGETGRLLTAHVTGNFGPAEYGGEPRTLSRAAPGAVSRVVDALATNAPDGYDMGIECTHHGPTDTAVPSLFVEVGSDEPQWSDPAAAGAVARAVLDLRGTGPNLVGGDGRPRHVVGFGGGHYAPRFTRIVRDSEWTVGHVAADWGLGEMGAPEANRDVIAAAFERSNADYAVIDGNRPALAETVEALGHRVVSETWIRVVGDRPLALVETLEERVAPVAEGLRFGAVVPDGFEGGSGDDGPRDAVVVREFPAELLARAQGINGADADSDGNAVDADGDDNAVDADGDDNADDAVGDAARAVVEANAVAFETEQAGTRAVGRVAFAAAATAPGYDDLVADLASVLETAYDEVTIERTPGDDPDAVVARETAFDPERAAIRGVPEGPAFGTLADGEAVEINGETVRPAEVSRETEERFPIDPA